MKQSLLLLIATLFTLLSVKAQLTTPRLSAGIDLGVTTGNITNYFIGSGGLSLKLELPVPSTHISFTLTGGYTTFSQRGSNITSYYSGPDGTYVTYRKLYAGFIPLEAGARFYLAKRFFIEGDAGASININSNYQAYTGEKTAFIYAPIAGFSIPINKSGESSIDLSLRYENRAENVHNYYKYQQIALRAAYAFGL